MSSQKFQQALSAIGLGGTRLWRPLLYGGACQLKVRLGLDCRCRASLAGVASNASAPTVQGARQGDGARQTARKLLTDGRFAK